jgi:hypothetical protein
MYIAGWGRRPIGNSTYVPDNQFKTQIPVVDGNLPEYCLKYGEFHQAYQICAGIGDGNGTCKVRQLHKSAHNLG